MRDLLIQAIRQYRHNDSPGFVFGYDEETVERLVLVVPQNYMPTSLGKKQELFSRLLPGLFLKAFSLGFEIRSGDLFRDPRVHGLLGKIIELCFPGTRYGHKYSCHKLKLAIDLNLMQNGKFLRKSKEYKELGDWWEDQHPLCEWGGRFSKPDGNHFSLTHRGYK